VSVRRLETSGHVALRPGPGAGQGKLVHLTPQGRRAQDHDCQLSTLIEERWQQRFGAARLDRLRESLLRLYDGPEDGRPRLAEGLIPYPDGWRAHQPYLTSTTAMTRAPARALARYPAISHRGGFPDGS
jgi:hypothetical protein